MPFAQKIVKKCVGFAHNYCDIFIKYMTSKPFSCNTSQILLRKIFKKLYFMKSSKNQQKLKGISKNHFSEMPSYKLHNITVRNWQ